MIIVTVVQLQVIYISSVQHFVKFLVTFHLIYIPYDLYKNYIIILEQRFMREICVLVYANQSNFKITVPRTGCVCEN